MFSVSWRRLVHHVRVESYSCAVERLGKRALGVQLCHELVDGLRWTGHGDCAQGIVTSGNHTVAATSLRLAPRHT